MKNRAFLFLCAILLAGIAKGQTKTENVILVTLDGFRWQELFGGADKQLITKEFVGDSAGLIRKYWSDNAGERRAKLLPFFWNVIAKNGQLHGNRNAGSKVNVSNRQWFSYPGYNEILCGFADDEHVHSNDKFDNPNTNVLEAINALPSFRGKVAAFTSWDVFPYIIHTKRSGVPVNAGLTKKMDQPNERELWMNELMFQVPNPLGDVRPDVFTFNFAFEHLKRNNPRMLYIAFDETDDFAHGGKYDLYLESAHYTDSFLQTLWTWLQKDSFYKDKTTLIITTDHGRGWKSIDAWRHHGIKVEDADQIWVAVLGPDTPNLGEVRVDDQLYQNQIAQTIATLLRVDYRSNKPTGSKIAIAVK